MYLILKNSINEKMAINVEQISSIRTEFVQKIVLNEDGSSEKSNSYTVIIKTSSSNDEYRLNYCKDTIEKQMKN